MLWALSLPSFAVGVENSSLLNGYVPGQPNYFVLRLPAVTNLGSYNVELLLTSPTGVAGTDFYFDAVATHSISPGYVFPNASNFFTAANTLSGNRHSLTISDFALAGTDIVPGVNDGIATVVFKTSPGFNGALSLALGQDSFQLDTPATVPTPVTGLATARSSVASNVDATVTPVPEPNIVCLLNIAFIAATCAVRRREP